MNFLKSHPARIYGLIVALLPVVAHFLPDVPTEAVLAVAAAILGTGEAVQRVENTKTADAYWTDAYGE
jgi:hypothetical protein